MDKDLREKYIDELLLYLTLPSPTKEPGRSWHNVELNYFKEAEPFGIHEDAFSPDHEYFSDTKPHDSPHFDITSIVSPTGPFDSKPKYNHLYSIERIRRASPKECRGRIARFYPIIGEISQANIYSNGLYRSARAYFGWDGKNWKYCSITGSNADTQEKTNIQFATTICRNLYRRYQWRAVVDYGFGGSLTFVTDPVGAREIFKLRDIPEGKLKRESLRNWISQHWRKKHHDPSALTEVRKHLRGQTIFNWNGMRVQIKPSEYDLELNIEKLA